MIWWQKLYIPLLFHYTKTLRHRKPIGEKCGTRTREDGVEVPVGQGTETSVDELRDMPTDILVPSLRESGVPTPVLVALLSVPERKIRIAELLEGDAVYPFRGRSNVRTVLSWR